MAIGSPAVCLQWCVGRALAAGATADEIADALLAIAPVPGLGRVVAAAPDVATGQDSTALSLDRTGRGAQQPRQDAEAPGMRMGPGMG